MSAEDDPLRPTPDGVRAPRTTRPEALNDTKDVYLECPLCGWITDTMPNVPKARTLLNYEWRNHFRHTHTPWPIIRHSDV